MSDHHASPWAIFLAEITAAGIGGHAIESLSHLPGWVGGLFGGLVMGVTLRLLDPLLRVHGETIARRLTPPPAVPTGLTRCVLIVEDHPSGEILATHLRLALDVPVHVAKTAAEGRGMAQRYRPAAIFCDLALPDEHGDEMLAAIGRPGVVLMSGAADAVDLAAAAKRCHAVPLAKPLDDARVLAEALRMLDAATA